MKKRLFCWVLFGLIRGSSGELGFGRVSQAVFGIVNTYSSFFVGRLVQDYSTLNPKP